MTRDGGDGARRRLGGHARWWGRWWGLLLTQTRTKRTPRALLQLKIQRRSRPYCQAFGKNKESTTSLILNELQQLREDSKQSDKDLMSVLERFAFGAPYCSRARRRGEQEAQCLNRYREECGRILQMSWRTLQSQLGHNYHGGDDMDDVDLGSLLSTFASATQGRGDGQETVKNAVGERGHCGQASQLLQQQHQSRCVSMRAPLTTL